MQSFSTGVEVYLPKDFSALSQEWDMLNEKVNNSPTLNSIVVSLLLKYFGSGDEKVAVFRDSAGPVFMAVITKKNSYMWETFQPSQAPIGLWLMRADVSFDEVLGGLIRSLGGFVMGVGVTQLDPDHYTRPASQGCIKTLDYIETSRVTVSGSFDEYWQQRGKNLRQNLRRQRNRLAREEVETRLEVVTTSGEVAAAIHDYGVLESAGWKASGGTEINPNNAQGMFYRELLEQFCTKCQGYIYKYYYSDQLVAVDLCVEQAGVMVILKTTYDESIKTSSPAMLMREEMFKEIFDKQRFRVIEFYGRVMDWHTKWTTEMRTMYHLNCYRWPVIKLLT